MKIGALVRQGRKSRGWNQTELAKKMCVHQTHISQWENDEKRIYGDDLIKISHLLDLVEKIFPGYKKTNNQSDTRRYLTDRLCEVEASFSSQIKTLEQQLHEKHQKRINILITGSKNNLELLRKTTAYYCSKVNITTLNIKNLKQHDLENRSLIILDVPKNFSNKEICFREQEAPVIICIFSENMNLITEFIPGVIGVIEKPFKENDLEKTFSKMNLI